MPCAKVIDHGPAAAAGCCHEMKVNFVGTASAGLRYAPATQDKLRGCSQGAGGEGMTVSADISSDGDKNSVLELRAGVHGKNRVQIPIARATQPIVKLTTGKAIAGNPGRHVSQCFIILKHRNKSRTNGIRLSSRNWRLRQPKPRRFQVRTIPVSRIWSNRNSGRYDTPPGRAVTGHRISGNSAGLNVFRCLPCPRGHRQ